MIHGISVSVENGFITIEEEEEEEEDIYFFMSLPVLFIYISKWSHMKYDYYRIVRIKDVSSITIIS
jgi:hypothetical protein